MPGSVMFVNASNIPLTTASCVTALPGFPIVLPNGCSTAANLGTPTDEVNSGTLDNAIVENPAASIFLCTDPTDQLQIGQVGKRATTSTFSFFKFSMIAGTDFSSCSRGSRMYPIVE